MKNLILKCSTSLAMYTGLHILVPIIVGTSLKFTPEQIAYLVTVNLTVWGCHIFTSQ
ncbi:hypothetical protein ACV566_01995 [Staphylococcus aureus]